MERMRVVLININGEMWRFEGTAEEIKNEILDRDVLSMMKPGYSLEYSVISDFEQG